MPVHYRDGIPSFECCIARMHYGKEHCQTFNARWLEPMIEDLVFHSLQPASLQLSVEAAGSIEEDRARLETHHHQSVERATYEADVARRRYEEVDPSHRLVAAELEKRWEAALVAQRKCEEALNRIRQDTPARLTKEQKESIAALANNFQSLWESEATSGKDRQDLVRILIERIVVEVVDGSERLSVTVHWSGGYTSRHETRRTVATVDELEDSEALLRRAEQLYNSGYPREELVKRLNDEGYRPARKECFTTSSVNALILLLRRRGMITSRPALSKPFWRSSELGEQLGIGASTLSGWRDRGWVQAKQLGRRWIYWADDAELMRMKNLASHPRCGSTPVPKKLTAPTTALPAETSENS
jgi:hypothetical protein